MADMLPLMLRRVHAVLAVLPVYAPAGVHLSFLAAQGSGVRGRAMTGIYPSLLLVPILWRQARIPAAEPPPSVPVLLNQAQAMFKRYEKLDTEKACRTVIDYNNANYGNGKYTTEAILGSYNLCMNERDVYRTEVKAARETMTHVQAQNPSARNLLEIFMGLRQISERLAQLGHEPSLNPLGYVEASIDAHNLAGQFYVEVRERIIALETTCGKQ